MKASDLRKNLYKLPIHILFMIVTLTYIIPLIMIVSISFSDEAIIMGGIRQGGGYGLLPRGFTLDAYRLAFRNPQSIINGYLVTVFQSVVGTFLMLLVWGMIAYPLSRSNFAYKKPITTFLFITMLFSGGTIPTYIIYTQWYHLADNILVYILPGLSGGAWSIFMFRTYFKGNGESLYESAVLDGASEFTIFIRIAVPLAKPIFAALGFSTLVGKWNDWVTSLLYIRNPELYTLQYLLQRVLNEVNFVKSLAEKMPVGIDVSQFKMPSETLRYALCVIAAGPMLFVFPFFQKYFAKGLTVGSVKG